MSTVSLRYAAPFDWAGMLAFLAPRATAGVEAVDGAVYRRTVEVDGQAAVIEVTDAGGALRVRTPGHRAAPEIVGRLRRLFDLDADPVAIASRLRRSRRLARCVAARPGLRIPGAWDPFELAVRAVLGQQVTVRAATTLAGRLVAAFGRPIAGGAGLTHLFPRPETLAEADVARIGMPRARAATIRALARAAADRALAPEPHAGLETAIARLCAIPGIGPWTAHYVALRGLGLRDAFPAGDLGLRRALGNGRGPASAAAVARTAEAWRPWRGYAALHLWSKGGTT